MWKLVTLLASTSLLFVPLNSVNQQTNSSIREYPDPGYRKMGVYGGGPKDYFDYNLGKMSLGDNFADKKKWWADLKKHGPSSPHTVLTVYVGVRNGDDFETCRRRLDAWLKTEPQAPTFPELIPAICLEEENVSSRTGLLDRLARYIRDNYRIPVFQWYSDPFAPNPRLTADGWIWDSYGWKPDRFRRHVMSFVALGKPAICVPWASDPHWPQWTQYTDTTAMIDREWHQFTTCQEFDVSTAPFCVAGPGAVNPWLGGSSRDMHSLRSALRTKRLAMRAIGPNDLPLATANFSAAARSIPVGGSKNEPSRYVEQFDGFAWIHDATITGFLDLMLTSRPDEPGFLVIRPRPRQGAETEERPADASLMYHLHSHLPLKSVRVRLKANAPAELGARTQIGLSSDVFGREWLQQQHLTECDELRTLSLNVQELNGTRDVYLHVQTQQQNGRHDRVAHRLDELVIECEHMEPTAGSAIQLVADQYGGLSYDDDFSTSRWRHFGSVTTDDAAHGGYRTGTFWVGMKGGFGITTGVVQRVLSPRPLKELQVTIGTIANSTDLGGTATLGVGPRGGKPFVTAATKGRHNGPLVLTVPPDKLSDLTEFDVSVTLHSRSGVEGGDRACATLESLSVEAR